MNMDWIAEVLGSLEPCLKADGVTEIQTLMHEARIVSVEEAVRGIEPANVTNKPSSPPPSWRPSLISGHHMSWQAFRTTSPNGVLALHQINDVGPLLFVMVLGTVEDAYSTRYLNQVMICSKVVFGAKTELSRTVDGKSDWMLFEHSNAAQDRLEHWSLIDLKAFAQALSDTGLAVTRSERETNETLM